MKYFEITLLVQGRKEIRHLKASTRAEVLNLAQSNFSGTVMKAKEVPLPLSVQLEEFKAEYIDKIFAEKLNTKEFIIFLKQVSVMTNAGIPLREALFEGMTATEDKVIKVITQDVIENIDSGYSLTNAFKEHEKVLGQISISMIELGEQTGSLSESLHRLSEILEEIDDNKVKIKKAMRMPLISLGAMLAAFVTLILLVVPKFQAIFNKLGGELPLPTRFLIGMEYFLSNFGYVLVLLFIGLFFIHKKFYNTKEDYRIRVDKIISKTYILGSITTLGMYSRFMMILSELIKAGLPLGDALKSAGLTIENSFIKSKLELVGSSIQKGHSLAESLESTKLFENMTIQMVKAGESGGELDTMLSKISDYYKDRFQNIVDNISTLIEPVMMGLIAVLVLVLALGIFLPMWELSSVAMGH